MAQKCGFRANEIRFPASITQQQLIHSIQSLNSSPSTHAILLQLPLPPHLNQHRILSEISEKKNVDGLSVDNFGRLALEGVAEGEKGGREGKREENDTPSPLLPCTPAAVLEILERESVSLEGKRVVVVGKSAIVGLPLSLSLLSHRATVTVCHRKTKNLQEIIKQGEIVITAAGSPKLIKGNWLSPGAVVVDVGVNEVTSQEQHQQQQKRRVVGDVDFDSAIGVAGLLTPVPGGVG
eukprot:CAMPEP_0201531968 /NCGR_PEP_ID=MMETSP0161_2-20130828/49107_1 /ASSEMBLY_ACC=CAM_ASM_000251 /TAXON_ID=180227 /ORGANISM="Neoparamoeba aestuarina, Strain SoJaBio B1-5/56/2" /LENGTH=236 /DNA_ID=CAMNT_0047935137 /DNA_START=296 /DNA_END=1003 /DNA_ORIENTATION=-